jgi:putative ABC transport system substrate-binding protein
MRRRDFIGLLGGVVASRPLPAFAQGSSTRPLIVISVGGSKTRTDRYFDGFLQGMRELGYTEGRDYGFKVRYADAQYGHIPAQTDELVRLKPDIIVSGTMAGVLAAKKLTNTVPIVSETLIDPIGLGLLR